MRQLTLQNPVQFFVPIARVNDEDRTVTGYCYTQAKVTGDKWNLKREALERAGVKYMEMPCVRAMHGPVAAGNGISLEWDEKGGKLTVEIVDDNEWKKVQKGVYRGFSIGGRPLVTRGTDVESFEWVETSLVDRPCDPGALFTMARADGIATAEAEYPVIALEEGEVTPLPVDVSADVDAVLQRLENGQAPAVDEPNFDHEDLPQIPNSSENETPDADDEDVEDETELPVDGAVAPSVFDEPVSPLTTTDPTNNNSPEGQDDQRADEQGGGGNVDDGGQPAETERAESIGSPGSPGGDESPVGIDPEVGGEAAGSNAAERGTGDGGNDPQSDAGAGIEGTASAPATGERPAEGAVRPDLPPGRRGSVRRDGAPGAGSPVRDVEAEPAPGAGHRGDAERPAGVAEDAGTPGDGEQPQLTAEGESGVATPEALTDGDVTPETSLDVERAAWQESLHPRANDGKFGHNSGKLPEAVHADVHKALQATGNVHFMSMIQAPHAVYLSDNPKKTAEACKARIEALPKFKDITVEGPIDHKDGSFRLRVGFPMGTNNIIISPQPKRADDYLELERKYNPDQPRRPDGKFGSGGATKAKTGPAPEAAPAHEKAQSATAKVIASLAKSAGGAAVGAHGLLSNALEHVDAALKGTPTGHFAAKYYESAQVALKDIKGNLGDAREQHHAAAQEVREKVMGHLFKAGKAIGVQRSFSDSVLMRVLDISAVSIDREVAADLARAEAGNLEIERGAPLGNTNAAGHHKVLQSGIRVIAGEVGKAQRHLTHVVDSEYRGDELGTSTHNPAGVIAVLGKVKYGVGKLRAGLPDDHPAHPHLEKLGWSADEAIDRAKNGHDAGYVLNAVQKVMQHAHNASNTAPGSMHQEANRGDDDIEVERAEWDESKHPRANDGKFGSGGGSAPAKKESPDAKDQPRERSRIEGDVPPGEARVGVGAMDTPPPPAIPSVPNLTPAERKVEQAFMKAFAKNPDGVAANFRAMVTALPGTPTFGTDDAKQLDDNWAGGGDMSNEDRAKNRATLNVPLHQTANAIAKRAFLQHLDTMKRGEEIMVTVGGCGAGKGYALGNVPEAQEVAGRCGVVWDSAGDQNAAENPWVLREAKARGLKVNYVFVHADPKVQWAHPERGVVQRAQKTSDGRMVDAHVFADSYALGAKNHQAFYDKHKGDAAANFIFLENGAPPKKLDGVPAEALKYNADELRAFAIDTIKKSNAPEHVKDGGTIGGRIWEQK